MSSSAKPPAPPAFAGEYSKQPKAASSGSASASNSLQLPGGGGGGGAGDAAPRKKSVLVAGHSLPTSFAMPSFVPRKESQWVPDRERDACIICSKSFGLMRRRHHCRGCGDVFCEACSNFKLIAKANVSASHEITPVRVCKACFEVFGVSEGEALYAAPKPASAGSAAAAPAVAAAVVATAAVAAVAAGSTTPAADATAKPTNATPASQPESVHPLLSFLPPALASQPLLLLSASGGFVLLVLILATKDGAFSLTGAATLLPIMAAALYLHLSVTPVVPIAAPVAKPRASSAAFHKPSLAHVSGAGKASNGAAMAGGAAVMVGGGAAMAGASLMRSRTSTMQPESASSPTAAARGGTPPRAVSNADRLSPADAEIVRRSRLAHAAVVALAADLTGWRTLKQTKPDGTGSVSIKDERAAVDWNAFVAAYDQSVIVQSKMVSDPIAAATPAAAAASAAATPASASSASAASAPAAAAAVPDSDKRSSSSASSLGLHPVWKCVSVVAHPPEVLFRLLCDLEGQARWNRALLECRVLKSIAGSRTTVSYGVSAPAVDGAVSSREFVDTHDWSCDQRVDDSSGRVHTDYSYAGVGLENSEGTGIDVPAHAKLGRGLHGPSGFVLRSIDPSPASRALPGASKDDRWTLLTIVLDTTVRGWIPKALTDSAIVDLLVENTTSYREGFDARTKDNTPLPPMPPDQETGMIRKASAP